MNEIEKLERRKNRRDELMVAAAFVRACKGRDPQGLIEASDLVSQCASPTAWRATIRKVAREVSSVSPEIQSAFLGIWIGHNYMSNVVRDNWAMYTAARALLPRYRGPAVLLFRGSVHRELRRRTGVSSWTSNIEVADQFAQQRKGNGEGVILQTLAQPKAILCDMAAAGGPIDESEYIVERRYLTNIRVVRRYPKIGETA